jgi:hypothetical protein
VDSRCLSSDENDCDDSGEEVDCSMGGVKKAKVKGRTDQQKMIDANDVRHEVSTHVHDIADVHLHAFHVHDPPPAQ